MAENPYDTLGVGRDASDDDIRSAYRLMAKRHHPDARGGDAAAFKAVNEAYGLLTDPSRRSAFDRETARPSAAASTVDVHVGREYDPFAGSRATSRSPIEPFDRLFERFVGTRFLRTDPFHPHDTADYDVYLSRVEAATGVTATIDVGFGRARIAIPPGITDGVRLSALVRQQRITFHVHVAGG